MSLLVAVGYGGLIVTSPDGITWAKQTPANGAKLDGVCASSALGMVVAVGAGGNVHTSKNGVTWTAQTIIVVKDLNSVCWSPSLELFVAVGDMIDSTVGPICITSPDGINWTQRSIPNNGTFSQLKGVTWGEEKGLFVAVGQNTYHVSSPDGITWTKRNTGSGVTYEDIEFDGANFMVVGQENWYSGTGTSFAYIGVTNGTSAMTRRPGGSAGGLMNAYCVALGNVWVVGGDHLSGSYYPAIASSADGWTWGSRYQDTILANSQFRGLVWDGSQFIAVGHFVTDDAHIFTSPTGANWTEITNPADSDLYAITLFAFSATSQTPIVIDIETPPIEETEEELQRTGGGFATGGAAGAGRTPALSKPDSASTRASHKELKGKRGLLDY